MTKLSELRTAGPASVVAMLEGSAFRDNNDPTELKAALLNALDRIAALESDVNDLVQVVGHLKSKG